MSQKIDKSNIDKRKQILLDAAKTLKSEFFGLDDTIDKIINSMQSWYIFPEIINRPVIINLWGLTGGGKTSIVRRIASLLNFSDKFVEIQMDGGNNSTYGTKSISGTLSAACIEEGEPGILLLDEIQRFKTVDSQGDDIKTDVYKDLWTLLSDGKFSSKSDIFNEIDMMLCDHKFERDRHTVISMDDLDLPLMEDGNGGLASSNISLANSYYKRSPGRAMDIKSMLRLQESIEEIMAWDQDKIINTAIHIKNTRETWEYDYTKLVIFISGNLDSAFIGANSTEDCDTGADFYHEQTKKITLTEIKEELKTRFRPEQISRLGNNHIIYPSLSQESYERLIHTTCMKYINEMTTLSGIKYNLHKCIEDTIYKNSVFPTQGTRPVFSSVHMIFSGILSEVTFWCIENDINEVSLSMESDKSILATSGALSKSFPVTLDITLKKEKTSLDYKTIVAVHEAGHALIYSILNNVPPLEIRINTAAYAGGYILPSENKLFQTKTTLYNKICILYGGRVAEELIFGSENVTSGAISDISKATSEASIMVRKLAFGNHLGEIDQAAAHDTDYLTNIVDTDREIEVILSNQYNRAKEILTANLKPLKIIVDALLEKSVILSNELKLLVGDYIDFTKPTNIYVDMWKSKSKEIDNV